MLTMLFILGFILGIIWLIFLCIIAILLIIKIVNRIRHKTESLRFQKIFTFLLKSIIPFFLVLFFVGGCRTTFANPKFHYCIVERILNNNHYCEYTNYGIFIEGNEGSGMRIYFKETK